MRCGNKRLAERQSKHLHLSTCLIDGLPAGWLALFLPLPPSSQSMSGSMRGRNVRCYVACLRDRSEILCTVSSAYSLEIDSCDYRGQKCNCQGRWPTSNPVFTYHHWKAGTTSGCVSCCQKQFGQIVAESAENHLGEILQNTNQN